MSTYPALFAYLIGKGWSDEDLQKLAGKNLIRAFTRAEQVNINHFSAIHHKCHLLIIMHTFEVKVANNMSPYQMASIAAV